MNLAENRGPKFCLLFSRSCSRTIDNMQNITRPIHQVVIVIEFRLEINHGYPAKQIIKCPVTP